jgi:ubiquinone/menaquinone biosynthesis C-methylase UbiE
MIPYSAPPSLILKAGNKEIASFISGDEQNIDKKTVESFGEEWTKFDSFSADEIKNAGDQYFDIVSYKVLNKTTVVLDLGCGTGRWSKYIGDKAGFIEAIDPSAAVFAAQHLTADMTNIRITQASSDNIPFGDETFDMMMSLGVLHNIPDTGLALKSGVKKVKRGGYVLLYLYYALDNRSFLFKALFYASALIRYIVSSLPASLKKVVCDLIAVFIYMPFVYTSRAIKALSPGSQLYNKVPLSYYYDKSYNIIRNDALDRFGTPLEQRFSRQQIDEMMRSAGLTDIVFSENMPYWHVLGRKQ